MKNKTAVVTGATNGIGLVTALELAKAGARVLIVARNESKGQAVLEQIKNQTGQTAELFLGDLSLVKDADRVGKEIAGVAQKIDVLVNNAGGMFTERLETKEGLEMTFALNHMAYFVLTNALLEPLKAAGKARVISVSSDAHKVGRILWDDLQASRKYDAMSQYGRSKLMNVLFSNELARRLEGTGITSNALHPGVVNTGFAADTKGIWSWVFKLAKPFMITPEKGARTMLHLATSPDLEITTGMYWQNERPATASSAAMDQTSQKHLWLESERLLQTILQS